MRSSRYLGKCAIERLTEFKCIPQRTNTLEHPRPCVLYVFAAKMLPFVQIQYHRNGIKLRPFDQKTALKISRKKLLVLLFASRGNARCAKEDGDLLRQRSNAGEMLQD